MHSLCCNHHLCLMPKHFRHRRENPVPIKLSLPIFLSPEPLATISLYGFTSSAYFINVESEYVPFHVWLFFTYHHVFKVHPGCSMYQYVIPFYSCIMFHYMNMQSLSNVNRKGHRPHLPMSKNLWLSLKHHQENETLFFSCIFS